MENRASTDSGTKNDIAYVVSRGFMRGTGSRLTGWQTIEGAPFFFNSDGVMHEGEKQEPQTGSWYVYNGKGQMPDAVKKE